MSAKPKWIKCRVSNLWRNRESGIYFARVYVGGSDVWRSLDTDAESIAKLRLPRKLAEVRAGHGKLSGGNLSCGECAAIYIARKKERGYARKNKNTFKPLKARSLDYRNETLASIPEYWDGFDDLKAALVTDRDCQTFADKIRRHYGATRFNGIIQTLRGVLAIAVECGCLEHNPAACIGFAEIELKEKFVPSREQFTDILKMMDDHPRRKFARISIRAMAFTGLRPREARCIAPDDVNLEKGTLTARETKNGRPRTIQLIDQAAELFEQEGVATVIAALKKSPRKALTTICAKLKLPNLTPYTMRYLHLTALIESGVDIGVAADIAGHQDRGVTLLRNYRQTRPDHLRAQIKKVFV